jgi:hypothetical protein
MLPQLGRVLRQLMEIRTLWLELFIFWKEWLMGEQGR